MKRSNKALSFLQLLIAENYKSLLVKNSFVQNLAITFSGNAAAISLGFLFTPIIARIYTPEAYGIFALFLAVSQNIGNIATLQFTRAYVLPKEESEFLRLVKITLLSTLFFTAFSAIVFLFFGTSVLSLFNARSLGNYILVVPFAVFILSCNDILRSWNIRIKEFRRGAVTRIISTLFARVFTLIYGLITLGASQGLIVGDLLAKPIDSFFALNKSNRRKIPLLFRNYNFRDLKTTFKKYSSYPLYVLPSNWISNFSNQIPIFFLISAFDPTVTGNYSLANSLLNIPGALLSAAIAPVFLQKAAETYQLNPDNLPALVLKLYKRLFYLGVLPFSILIVYGEYVFSFFVGDQWTLAGKFAGYMGVYFVFWMMSSALSSLYRIYNKEQQSLITNVLSIFLKTLGLLIGIYYKDYILTIMLFSLGNLIGYLLHCFLILKLTRLPSFKLIFESISVLTFLILFLLSLKFWLS